PTWSTLKVGAGGATYSGTTPAGQISNFRQTLFLRCGVLRTSLTWTPSAGRATDLTYEVIAARNSPHVGAVHLTMTPHWSGSATVTDVLDGAGARRLVQKGGGKIAGSPGTMDVNFVTETLGTAGTLASTLDTGAGVNVTSRSISPNAKNLTVSDAVTFPVKAGSSYELS